MIQLELLPKESTQVLNDKDKILQYQLITIRAGLKLEMKGMKKRGQSCSAAAKQMLGLAPSTPRGEVLQALDAMINTFNP